MAKSKTSKVVIDVKSLKNLSSDQLTEIVEAILVTLVENSKLKEAFKKILTDLIKEIENQVNPDTAIAAETTPIVVESKKKWWTYVIEILTYVGPLLISLFTKGKVKKIK